MKPQNFKYIVREKGSPLEATSATKPTGLDSKEVLIQIKAIAINPADFKMIDLGHRVTAWPLVPGLDGAGVVEGLGSSVQNLKLGERVLALFTPGDRSASYQTYSVVKENDVAKIPASWTFEQASTLGYVTGIPIFPSRPFPFILLTLVMTKLIVQSLLFDIHHGTWNRTEDTIAVSQRRCNGGIRAPLCSHPWWQLCPRGRHNPTASTCGPWL
jgi:hypothetical protein